MTSTSPQRWLALAAAAILGLALTSQLVWQPSASASTVPSMQITSALTAFNSTAVKTVAATCPAGKRVIGGGGRVNGAQHVVITQQRPVHGSLGDRFVVSASEDQFGTSALWAVQAFATCSSPLTGLEIIAATGVAGSSGFQVATARCSAGKFALGAGGRITGGAGQVSLNTQGGGGTFSQSTAASGLEDRDGFAGTWNETAFAVCATVNDLSSIALVQTQSAADTTARKIIDVFCPAGMHVTGGAAFAGFPAVVESVSPDPTRVQVIAREDGLVGPADRWAVTVFAFCAS